MTELDFILIYCLDYIEEVIKDNIMTNAEDELDTCWIKYLDMKNTVDIDGMTDIINATVTTNYNLFFFVSNEDDSYQTYATLSDMSRENIFEILMQILN